MLLRARVDFAFVRRAKKQRYTPLRLHTERSPKFIHANRRESSNHPRKEDKEASSHLGQHQIKTQYLLGRDPGNPSSAAAAELSNAELSCSVYEPPSLQGRHGRLDAALSCRPHSPVSRKHKRQRRIMSGIPPRPRRLVPYRTAKPHRYVLQWMALHSEYLAEAFFKPSN